MRLDVVNKIVLCALMSCLNCCMHAGVGFWSLMGISYSLWFVMLPEVVQFSRHCKQKHTSCTCQSDPVMSK